MAINFGFANDYNVFVFGDMNLSNTDAEGRVAVGGNATLSNYGVGAGIFPLPPAYVLAKMGYDSIWPLFGASNQRLSALAFLACAVFFKRTRRRSFMLWVPMFTMIAVTFTALSVTIWQLASGIAGGTYRWVSGITTTVDGASVLTAWGAGLQLVFAVLILALGVVVVIQGIRKLMEKVPAAPDARRPATRAR